MSLLWEQQNVELPNCFTNFHLDSLQQEHFQFFPSVQNDTQNFESYLQSQANLQTKHTEQQKLNKINASNRRENIV